MASVLYSCFGTSDPVRGLKDGGLMHILRFYRPETVYLFLTDEIVKQDKKDQRITKTFSFIRKNWGGYNPQLIRIDTEIKDPSDMDILMGRRPARTDPAACPASGLPQPLSLIPGRGGRSGTYGVWIAGQSRELSLSGI